MAKKKDIVVSKNSVVISNSSNPNIVPYSFSSDRIEKVNCNLCQSDYRDEAEEIYEGQKRKNYSDIMRKLKTDHNFDASVNGIKNHMLYHYKATHNNATSKEYTEDVQRWMDMQINKVAALKARIAILEREMFIIAQSGDELDIIERRKNAETVKKLAETILVYENKLAEYSEEVKPVNLVFNQLKVIVNDELQHVSNHKTRQVLGTILSRLQDSVGSMIIE